MRIWTCSDCAEKMKLANKKNRSCVAWAAVKTLWNLIVLIDLTPIKNMTRN